MAGAGIHVDLRKGAAESALKHLAAGVRDPRPALDEIGGRLVASTIERFQAERGPDGTPWKPSRRARREGGRTLTDTGRLRASITHRATRTTLEVGTNVVYAAIHQFGGRTPPRTIRPRKKKALWWRGAPHPVAKVEHPGSTIPARPFLGIDEGDRTMVIHVVSRYLQRRAA